MTEFDSSGNELSPGSTLLSGSQLAKQALGNLLWRGAKGVAEGAWDLVKVPGQVAEGSAVPAGSPWANRLGVPEVNPTEYGAGLAGFGLGAGNLLGGAGEGVARQFGAWHGTGARPFQEFSDDFLRSGEGHMTYGHGHYVGQAEKTGERYRQQVSGGGLVPLDEKGFPLSDEEVFNKFYEPGTIVPSYGGRFDRVIDNAPDAYGGYQTRVQTVHPNIYLLGDPEALAALPEPARDALKRFDSTQDLSAPNAAGDEPILADFLRHSELWRDAPGANPRVHATFPSTRDVERVGQARGWNLGESGGLLHINVIPEEHEFLDWDLPFSQQSPQVQERLNAAGTITYPRANQTGEDIYKGRFNELLDDGVPWDEAWEQTSMDLKEAGIPGNKYLDQQSRGKIPQPILKHADDFKTAPNPQMAEQYLKDFPATVYSKGGGIDGEISHVSNYIREHADTTLRASSSYTNRPDIANSMRGEAVDLHRMADWMQSEHAAGKFSIGDNRTRNFVVFDPKDLEIRTWNGRPLEPVEGDPFDVTRP